MVIVDTSVWINLFRRGDRVLSLLLEGGMVVIHDYILGELACGNISNRAEILKFLQDLPGVGSVTINELLSFIENYSLNSKGLGFVDINLLASSKLSGYPLFTYDKKLISVAELLNLNFKKQ
jgi:predicted nucleic acid-binding protein